MNPDEECDYVEGLAEIAPDLAVATDYSDVYGDSPDPTGVGS
jgi:hypothetical protein